MSVYDEIKAERDYQIDKWGEDFDSKNTANDWVAYITAYLGQAYTIPFNKVQYRKFLIKVATLAVAAVETLDREGNPAPRHFD